MVIIIIPYGDHCSYSKIINLDQTSLANSYFMQVKLWTLQELLWAIHLFRQLTKAWVAALSPCTCKNVGGGYSYTFHDDIGCNMTTVKLSYEYLTDYIPTLILVRDFL